MMLGSRRAPIAALAFSLALGCGGGSTSPTPTPSPSGGGSLPAQPVAVTPAAGVEAESDTPTFTVRNAQGFDAAQADYTFTVLTAGRGRAVAQGTVAAGSGSTSFTSPLLPQATALVWEAVGRSRTTGATVSSGRVAFRSRRVTCAPSGDRYGKSIVDSFLTACSRARNRFNDPREVLGPPDSSGRAPDFTGFMSLGEGGHVTVDMEVCTTDAPGPDIRVWQRASNEPVTLYASGRPEGPYVLLAARVPCGTLAPETGLRSGYCEFNLGEAEMSDARYFKIEDGELFPCERAGTDTEGADIDAIEILNRKQ